MFHGLRDVAYSAMLALWWIGIGFQLICTYFFPQHASFDKSHILGQMAVVLLSEIVHLMKRSK